MGALKMKKMWKLIALVTAVLTLAVVSCKKEAAPAVTAASAVTAEVEATSDVVVDTTADVVDATADVVDATADATSDAE